METDRPNILLVILDTTRAENCSLYGYQRETTPFLERFASEATVYTQARAPGPDSILSHVSMWSGLSVPDHGVYSYMEEIEAGHSIWEELRDEGYSTGAFTENPFFTIEDIGLCHGFQTVCGPLPKPFKSGLNPKEYVGSKEQFFRDAWQSKTPIRSGVNGLGTKFVNTKIGSRIEPYLSTNADDYVDAFLNWEREIETPWAAVVNLMDAHGPYYPSRKNDRWSSRADWRTQDDVDEMIWDFASGRRPWHDRKRLIGLYDGGIRDADAGVFHLVNQLKKRGELGNTLLVITADHGEAFGEESRIRDGIRISQHSTGLHECLTWVPLVVSRPGQSEGACIDKPVSLTRFYEVASAAARQQREPFVKDEPVLAATPGIENRMTMPETVRKHCPDDYDRYTGDLVAEYGMSEDGVTKTLRWKDRKATVVCPSPGSSYRTDYTTPDVELREFGTKSIAADKTETVDGNTLKRLQDLGYA
ncbi:sulfatase-like hydrolase/transferase [Haloterrigena sp. SYSU A558-1]|uniref:Sulfatase-like hydrolase/transferase n=1 Tax=Haloterrigena gelatinilytica TaxID=2741724 RepID=A0ABX2L660_9EURY|nr:sulfatase-like hydrolase/transferase [Haloterrigena gelatinilytica]NUC70865.1 sulfatase-like hydrolase/transferase [Haloterrigena gelatinilytica]